MGRENNPYISSLISDLSDRGNSIIISAYKRANYSKNKTQNLHDSYGSAVYLDGILQRQSMRLMTASASVGRYNKYDGEIQKGADEIKKFFQRYKAINKGIELVVAVAMFYGQFLEDGTYADNGKKWKVISMAEDELEKIQREIKGSSIHTIRNGKRDG